MSTAELQQQPITEAPQVETDAPMQEHEPPTAPAAMAAGTRKRPRLDLNPETRERKRGKSMFGLVLGTLNKAKNEDKERNQSEAAKKRQLIEQRLQDKLRKETDTVRRAEEAKKDKTIANRKEEELQLKDSISKLRRTRLPLLANFLSTSDDIPSDDSAPTNHRPPLSELPRSHPPPLYYLPAVLLPSQEAFLAKRRIEVNEAAEAEWMSFREERTAGVEEIRTLRERVVEEEARKKAEREAGKPKDQDIVIADAEHPTDASLDNSAPPQPQPEPMHDAEMDVDNAAAANGSAPAEPKDKSKDDVKAAEPERKDEPAPMQADDDDAVEY